MRAYFVHDPKKELDHMVLPDRDLLVPADRRVMTDFIAPCPDFSQWRGKTLKGLLPESFGQILATRDEAGDVCILESPLWQKRMTFHLGNPLV